MVDTPPTTDPTAPAMGDVAAQNNTAAANEAVAHSASFSKEKLAEAAHQAGLTAAQQSLFTTALIGTAGGFKQVSASIDTTRVNTFSKQFEGLGQILQKDGTILGSVAKDANLLFGALTRMGASGSGITKALGGIAMASKEGVVAMLAYAKNLAEVADQHVYLQNSMVQGMAQTGELTLLYGKAGEGLHHFNEMSDKVSKSLAYASSTTNMDVAALKGMQEQLYTIPGFQRNLIESTGQSAKQLEFFGKSIQFMRGAGRDYPSMIEDMTLATKGFGVSQENALKYTARMSEAAEALHIPVGDLRGALNTSANAFKMFATEGNGVADSLGGIQESMSGYIKMLKDSGVPMQNAITLAGNLATSIAGMSTAQKAFLSAQSGGPGGLMGAAQINKLMMQGKTDEVFKMQRQAIQKSMGPLVSSDEASKSEEAAQRQQRQIQLLRSGPLGGQAKTDIDAIKILDAMKKGTSGASLPQVLGKGDTNLTLEKAIKEGNRISQTTDTSVSQIEKMIRAAQLAAGRPTLDKMQEFTARAGTTRGRGAGIHPELQGDIRRQERAAQSPSHEGGMAQALKDLKGLPMSVSIAAKAFADSLKTNNPRAIQRSSDAMNQSLVDWKAQMAKKPESVTADQKDTAELASTLFKVAAKEAASTAPKLGSLSDSGARPEDDEESSTSRQPPPDYNAAQLSIMKFQPDTIEGRSGGGFAPPKDYLGPPSKQVASAVQRAPKTSQTASQDSDDGQFSGPGSRTGGPVPVTLAPGSAITVNFTGTCPHCGQDQSTSAQSRVTSVASTLPRGKGQLA